MALGGVPMGVPIPPRLAAIGIDIASAILPLPSAGSDFITGVRKVSIIAAVAVLLMNIENQPVSSMKPSSTKRLCVPKGFSITLASVASSPLLEVAMAMMKPPINSMMIGSEKLLSIDL